MALDAATVIRASSAALTALLGLAVLLVSRGKVGALALGGLLGTFGAANVLFNLVAAPEEDPVIWILLHASAFAGLLAALTLPRRIARDEWPALAVGVVLVAALMGIAYADPPTLGGPLPLILRTFSLVAFPVMAAFTVIASVRVALKPPVDRGGWFASGALVGGFGCYTILRGPGIYGSDEASLPAFVTLLLLVAAIAVPWLVAGWRTRRRGPILVAIAAAALGLASYLYFAGPASAAGGVLDPWGLLGIARLLGWAVVVHAILRADLLGVPLPRLAVSKGALAAGSLATLFIVAQIAQNFLSASYGLLTGGVVAGAFLFAAQPIQRAIERVVSPSTSVPVRTPGAPVRLDENSRVYKIALRRFLRDGTITSEEEIALAHLADELGLGARVTTELRHEVERELGRRA